MFQNLEKTQEEIKIQAIVDASMLKLFDTSKNKDKVNYNLFDAFYMESKPVLEANVTIEFDTISGNDMPTVSTLQDTELNLLQASKGIQTATILAIEGGVQFSLKELRGGKINEARNIEFTSMNLMKKSLELIMKGQVASEFNTKKTQFGR